MNLFSKLAKLLGFASKVENTQVENTQVETTQVKKSFREEYCVTSSEGVMYFPTSNDSIFRNTKEKSYLVFKDGEEKIFKIGDKYISKSGTLGKNVCTFEVLLKSAKNYLNYQPKEKNKRSRKSK